MDKRLDFVDNLKLLCSHYSSIAEVCRKIGINRTQFNKYLTGQVSPSKANIRIICDFFGVEEFEIMMPHPQFQQQILPSPAQSNHNHSNDEFSDKISHLRQASAATLTRYLGWYYEYYFSLGYPGQVFKSLIEIKEGEQGLIYQRYERLINAGKQHEKITHCLYKGAVINLCDRIFLNDFEALTENEITQTILFPSYRSQIKSLYGLKVGVSSRSHRFPACTRVRYDFLGESISFKEYFRHCGLYHADALSAELIDSISNNMKADEALFYARGE